MQQLYIYVYLIYATNNYLFICLFGDNILLTDLCFFHFNQHGLAGVPVGTMLHTLASPC